MLEAYAKENELFKKQEVKLTREHSERIIKKLSRHFKLGIKKVDFRNYRCRGGTAKKFYDSITLIYEPSCLLVAHEVNHFLIWKKYPNRKVNHGSKVWIRNLARIVRYCEKNNWWKDEFENLEKKKLETIVKQSKKEDYKQTPQYKLDTILSSIRRWESKKRRADTTLKRLNRRKTIWEKKVKEFIEKKE